MMAASVVRNGIAGINIDSHSAIPPSQHSSSMHESSVTTPSAPSTTTHSSPPVVNSNEDQEEGKLGSNDQISSVSPAGKKLAVSSGQGPSASLVSSSSLIHEDETNIALSQLKELEVAIEVRKVTRVDGRKTRWIEYRREKQADIQAKQRSKSKAYPNKEKSPQRKGTLKGKKPIKVKVSKVKHHALQNVNDEKVDKPVNGEPIKEVREIKEDSPIIANNNNNNSIDKNKNKIEKNMKVEISGPIISTLGTSNVLETMKQQFMQGTVDIPEHASNGVKEKPSKKLSKSTNGVTPPNHVNNEHFKRKPGRPKKIDNMKGPPPKVTNSNSITKAEAPLSSQSVAVGTIPSLNTSSDSLAVTNKKVDLPPLAQSTTDFYARRNLLTKGLREVRKSESGSESGGSSPVKDGSPSLSPSPQLALSPISPLTPIASESSNTTNATSLKCPLITAAAKVLSTGAKKPKTVYGLAAKKKKGLKISKKENINLNHEANGHDSIPNGSANKDGKSGSVKTMTKSVPVFKKRGRGRKPKCKAREVPQKWAKTTSTVIVDVHNTMNGEPQTVIPVQNPILPRTKKSVTPPKLHKLSISESPKESDSKNTLLDSMKLSSNKQKEFVPPVPEIVNTSPLISRSSSPSFTSRKPSTKSESASKVSQASESGKIDSTKTKSEPNADDLKKVKNVPETLTPESSPSLEVQNSVPERVNKVEVKTDKGETDNLMGKTASTTSTDDQIVNESLTNSDLPNYRDSNLNDEKQMLIKKKNSEKSQRVKDIKQVGMKKNVGSILLVGESLRKQNSLDKKQKSIKEYASLSPKLVDNIYQNNSQLTNCIDLVKKNHSELIEKVEENVEICDAAEGSSVNITTTTTISLSSIANTEPKPITSKSLQSNISKGSLAGKSPRKILEKVKNKTLNAVLEKLYSPNSKKASNNIEKASETESKPPLSKERISPSENAIKENILSPLTTIEKVAINAVFQDGVENESNVENKVSDKEQAQIEKKKIKFQQCTINPNSDKVPAPSGKPKEKVPRFLKQLFQDEGVQNMLRSVSEEAVPNGDGNSNVDFSSHKLRPKRAHENFTSDSPEPDDSLLVPSAKRKKRGTEVDNLFVDEGALNLLTSLESGSRRPSLVDDAASDTSQGSSSKNSSLTTKTSKTQPESISSDTSKKRKLSENNTPSTGIIVGKVLHPQQEKDVKKAKLELPKTDLSSATVMKTESKKSSIVLEGPKAFAVEKQKKKPGRPSLPVPLKQKIKAQVIFQYRKQMNNLGISSDGLSVAEMREMLNKVKGSPKPATVKSVPPIKIKLPSGQERIVKQVPQSHESFSRQMVASQEKGTKPVDNSDKRVEFPKSAEPNHSVTSNEGAAQISSGPRVPTASTPNSRPLSNTVRSHPPPDKPKNYSNHNDNRPHPKCAANGPPRKAVSFARNAPQPQITSLVRPLDSSPTSQRGKVKGPGEGVRQSQRTSVRQSEGSYHYRDIALRKFNNFMQIILTPSTTKMKNSLNSRVLRELCEALSTLRRDESVRMVLITATGSTFCQGIDLTSLQHPNLDTRKKNAENLARGIKDFLRALVQFPKVIVAGVNGSAMGLGVTMLPLFDMVFATDKAEFFLPYAKLGQVPEGGATYTFPNYYGKLQSNRLFLGQKITASQAQQIGLVSESIWPATFYQELIPKVALLASQSPQSMEGTKALMNHHIITKLELSVESECRLLLQQWTSQNFSHLCKRFLDTSEVQLQKPVNLPL